MDTNDPIYKDLQEFANKHKLIFEDKGEVGFGRPCVGFIRGEQYVAFNPYSESFNNLTHMHDFAPIEGFQDERLYPPESVIDAYHKYDCLSVLVRNDNYDVALEQLHRWIKHLESLGKVEIATYPTGATGTQAIFSGLTGYAVRIRD